MLKLLLTGVLALVGIAIVAVAVLLATNPGPRESPGWALAAPMPAGRGEVTTAVVDGRLYVIGGLTGAPTRTSDEVAVYDPARDEWQAAPALPEGRHHTAAVGLDGSVYVSGGAGSLGHREPLAGLWQLPAGDDTWRELAPMPEGRYGHRLVTLDGRLYVVGGRGETTSVLVYDPPMAEWRTGAAMPVMRDHLAVVVVEGEIWAIGGRNGGLSAEVLIYDPEADTWRPGPDLPAATSGAAEAAADGLVLVSGGEDPAPGGDGVVDRHWWFDTAQPDAGWRELPRPPYAIHGAEGAIIDDRFYIVGGATRAGGLSFVAWSSALQVLDLDALRSD
jgi:N-acetylneuraminic acid mutarotase